MVLMVAELSRPDLDIAHLQAHYAEALQPTLRRWGWQPEPLQRALEQVRVAAIAADRAAWLALHRFYPGVPERLRALEREGASWMVLTTKGGIFAQELLQAAGLQPLAVCGHEQGSKPEVLAQLDPASRPIWFVEDRRPTLELVRTTPGLEAVRCFLVSWGYLAPADREALPRAIRLLEPHHFAAPLAQWP
jgi:hypothetical protein